MAEALAADIKEKILTCCICLGEYEDPRVLSCYHTFCFGCISDHASKTVSVDKTFQCPLCREEIKLPREGLVKLKKDFRVHTTKELLSQRQQHEVSSPNKETDVHDVTQAIAQMRISCEKHPNKELKYYCEDDDTVICGKCIVTEHSGHRISSVEQVAKISRDKIKAALMKTTKTTNMFKEAVALEAATGPRDSQTRAATIKCIQKQAQIMCRLIHQREETLISDVNSAYDNKQKQREEILEFHHASLQSACDFAQQLITNGTDSDIMVHAKSLIKRLEAMWKTPLPGTAAQISYSPGEISAAGLEAMLGQVTIQTRQQLARQRTYPRSAPQSPGLESMLGQVTTGLLYITSWGDRCVQVYTTRGQQVTTMGQDQRNLTTLNRRKSRPLGITLNRQGHVMVCDGRSILIFHADSEQFLDTIPLKKCKAPMQTTARRNPEYISDNCKMYIIVNSVNDNIVISNKDHHCIYMLSSFHQLNDKYDCSANQLYEYGGTRGSGDGELDGPCGVCTDIYGHIFIADCNNHRIVALDAQEECIRYIATQDDGLECPTALAINPAGQLVVAEEHGKVKTFQYLQ
ncbi:tripartite motif-containing protein 3-like [Lingula anatina]|uniref:Tripartite motif-containing protein 3-like n=1 Tax=Lingula anatina TaxID=7574 RepID=A0A1S3JC75_LINAN|nr:tripartite motif-containing protein 3-like [Lingula anatina]|eukprot:XP_013407928.1 tripartite motif-containing protein 3-like [Lingula anatina]